MEVSLGNIALDRVGVQPSLQAARSQDLSKLPRLSPPLLPTDISGLYPSAMSNSATPWTAACQAPLSMGFPRHEYWSELPFPTPGHLPDLGIEPVSLTLTGRFFSTAASPFLNPCIIFQGSPVHEARIIFVTWKSEHATPLCFKPLIVSTALPSGLNTNS